MEPKEKNASAESEKTDKLEFDLTSSEWYLNRELTWLEFNRRVLHEGEDERTPLLERIMFLAIVGGNLDEFFHEADRRPQAAGRGRGAQADRGRSDAVAD